MNVFKNAFAILVALAPAGLPAAAAPMSIEGGATVGMRESIPGGRARRAAAGLRHGAQIGLAR
jgi:hypothetical protein